jgi:hypothetical protein
MEKNELDLIAITELLNSRGWALIKEALIEERENKKENLVISSETEDEVLKGICQGLALALEMPEMIKKHLKNKDK